MEGPSGWTKRRDHGGPRPLLRVARPSRSLQRMTYGPLRARPSLSLPARERTCSRRVGETRAPASLPFLGENKRGLPLQRGLAARGYCDCPIGRPILAVRENTILQPVSPTILPERTNTGKPKQTRTDDPRPHRGPSSAEASAGGGGVSRPPCGPVTKRTPFDPSRKDECTESARNESLGRLGRPTAGRYGERYIFRST